jgi:phosphopantothenoylcysteine decarboxylase/phosphopantothenate--cysteine ligase
MGRMSEPTDIMSHLELVLSRSTDWIDKKVLVTSGPTREAIDPVRYLSNRSSGKMGDAISKQAYLAGAQVTLIRGNGAQGEPPHGVKVVKVENAQDMTSAVKSNFQHSDILIMTAAVSDWSIKNPSNVKLKKTDGPPEIKWKESEDILAWAGEHKNGQIIVGFALETNDHLQGGMSKLKSKNSDLIVLNDPTRPDSEFGGDTTKLTILSHKSTPLVFEKSSKNEAAQKLLDHIKTIKK